MRTVSSVPWRRRTALLAAMTVGLIAIADVLFYRQPVGWTWGLYVALLLLALTLRGTHYLRGWPGRALAAVELGLIAALVIEPTPLAVLLSMIGLMMIAAVDRGGWTTGVLTWACRGVEFVVGAAIAPLRDSRLARRWTRRHGVSARRLMIFAVIWRWAVPLLLTGVFVGLFALANPVIARWLANLKLELLDVTPGRIVLWLAAGFGAWALVRSRWRAARARQAEAADAPPTILSRAWDRLAGVGLIVRCLVLFNAAFAVQTLLDAAYLWGGAALPEGMTYAQYAHRGAYPLVATALLAAAFVLAAFRPRGPAEVSVWTRRLVCLWLAQNVILVASAAWRLSLYVDVYSLTRLRIAAAIWMLVVAAGLVWIGLRIVARRDNRWLLQANTLTAAAILYACAFVNFDGIIADFNVRHCAEVGGQGVALDTGYLVALGPESLPALTWLQQHVRPDAAVALNVPALRARLGGELTRQTSNWRGWTLRRQSLIGWM